MLYPFPKASKVDISNLRPISLLPVPAKILERLILQSNLARKFFENFGSSQFGARPKSSTTCAIISLIHHALTQLERNDVSGVQIIAYDYSKAFDILSHYEIVKRLQDTNFPSPFIEWIVNYLSYRTQSVRIGSTVSTVETVASGVPQGSVLGPTLYCLVAGGLDTLLPNSKIVKFIDDTTLILPITRGPTGFDNSSVVTEHQNMLDWSTRHGLKINVKKCKSLLIRKSPDLMPVTLNNVENVSELKLLGVTLNDKLSWNSHISCVMKTASKKMYALRILRPLLSKFELKKVYDALIRSILEYASPAYIGLLNNDAARIEAVQKRFHRFICRQHDCTCDDFQSLSSRRSAAAIKLFKRATEPDHILNAVISVPLPHGRFLQPHSRTTRFRNSFVPLTTILINNTVIE